MGVPFGVIKFGALFTWMVFGGISRPDAPWLVRLIAEQAVIGSGLLGTVLSVLMWPYNLFILVTQGWAAFGELMLYPWMSKT